MCTCGKTFGPLAYDHDKPKCPSCGTEDTRGWAYLLDVGAKTFYVED